MEIQHTVFHLTVYKKPPSEHYPDKLLCLTLVRRDDTVNGEGICTTAPTFSLTALQTLHPCCISPAFPVQCSPVHRSISKGNVALHACQAGTGTASQDSNSPGTVQSERSLMSLLRPFIFTVSSLSVLTHGLLIQLSFQSEVTSRRSHKDGL